MDQEQRDMLEDIYENVPSITTWEHDFIESVLLRHDSGRGLSQKQNTIVEDIIEKYAEGA